MKLSKCQAFSKREVSKAMFCWKKMPVLNWLAVRAVNGNSGMAFFHGMGGKLNSEGEVE